MNASFRKFLPYALITAILAPATFAAERPVPQYVARMDRQLLAEADTTARREPARNETSPAQPSAAANNSARDLVKALDRSSYFVKTVTARMNVTIRQGNGKATTLDGVYVGDDRGNLRLRLTGLFGILAMDVAVRDGTLTCWMPTHKLLVQATREELLSDAHSELALLAAAGQARDLFFPRPWTAEASQRRLYVDDVSARVGVFGGTEGTACLRQYELDLLAATIQNMEAFSRAGEPLGRLEFSAYAPLSKLDKDEKSEWRNAFQVPKKIRIADAQNRLSLECEVESLKVNAVLKENAFTLELPKNVEPQHPQALEKMAREMNGGLAATEK
jgi:hypothetical protein